MVPWTTPGKEVKDGGATDAFALCMELANGEAARRCAAVERESEVPVLVLGVVG